MFRQRLLDALYVLFALASAPWWLRKRRQDWRERFGAIAPLPRTDQPRVLIHAVSVGEVSLIRSLVEELAPDCDIVVSAMTDTGVARARALYEDSATVVRFPLDASFAVHRFLNAVAPDVVALVELEVWPNFVSLCAQRSIAVGVVNGRLSARSFARYRRITQLLKPTFARLAFVEAQSDVYAARFRALGAKRHRVRVSGSMKWDAALLGARDADLPQRAAALARTLGVDVNRPVIVAGSTAPEEHALLRDATPAGAQLICAPRRPEWFDDAARDLAPCARWSTAGAQERASNTHVHRFLLDVIGKLREAYYFADVVVVGRSFGSLHGSDPMEPAALGKPVCIGARVEDFADSVDALERAGALIRASRDTLAEDLTALLGDEARRLEMGARARGCVAMNAGATASSAHAIRTALRKKQEHTL